jgi:uncharacterized OB-fold protein
MTDFPQPDITATNRLFWEGLDQGRLLFQECDRGHRWLPARDFCPECLSSSFQFVEASGRATVLSWVVYRTAFNDAFKDRVPYNVSLVQLAEGPRMMTNVLCDPDVLAADLPVDLVIQKEDTCSVARFEPARGEAGPR